MLKDDDWMHRNISISFASTCLYYTAIVLCSWPVITSTFSSMQLAAQNSLFILWDPLTLYGILLILFYRWALRFLSPPLNPIDFFTYALWHD